MEFLSEVYNWQAQLSMSQAFALAIAITIAAGSAFAVCWPGGRKKSARIAAPVWNTDLK